MCQIQLIKVLGNKKLTKKDLNSFDNMMVQGAGSNPDAWGAFTKIDMCRFPESTRITHIDKRKETLKRLTGNEECDFIVGHNRLATQGDKHRKTNNHPFETKDFYMVHNGVIFNDDQLKRMKDLFYKSETDSAIIIEMIQALVDQGKTTIEAIKGTAELLSGSFSVVIYDKRNDKLYYFKNNSTSFYWGLFIQKNRKILVGSTSKHNFDFVYLKNDMGFVFTDYIKASDKVSESEVIYEVSNEGLKVVGTFEAEDYYKQWNNPTTYNKNYSNNLPSNVKITSKPTESKMERTKGLLEELFDELGFYVSVEHQQNPYGFWLDTAEIDDRDQESFEMMMEGYATQESWKTSYLMSWDKARKFLGDFGRILSDKKKQGEDEQDE